MKLTTSPRLEEMLQNMGIHSYLDVLGHLPRRYDNFTYTDSKCLSFLEDKQKVVLLGRILTKPRVQKFQRASVAKFYFREEKTHRDFAIEAWNRPYLAGNVELDSLYSLQGSYDRNGHCLNFPVRAVVVAKLLMRNLLHSCLARVCILQTRPGVPLSGEILSLLPHIPSMRVERDRHGQIRCLKMPLNLGTECYLHKSI